MKYPAVAILTFAILSVTCYAADAENEKKHNIQERLQIANDNYQDCINYCLAKQAPFSLFDSDVAYCSTHCQQLVMKSLQAEALFKQVITKKE